MANLRAYVHVKDILDKIIFGYLCQIITSSTFYQYIACISLKDGTNLGTQPGDT